MKRKKPTGNATGEPTESGLVKAIGKRKVEFSDEVTDVGRGKRARISEGDEP